jgi:hypothetical protein
LETATFVDDDELPRNLLQKFLIIHTKADREKADKDERAGEKKRCEAVCTLSMKTFGRKPNWNSWKTFMSKR